MNGGKKARGIEYGTKYLRSFKKLHALAKRKAHEKEAIFRTSPFDKRLDTHKLHGKFQDYWSYSVDNKNRVIFRFLDDGGILSFDIGLHPIYGKGE